jgi:uncharacterized membrane-anchored protein YitT (DUF2179 family)
MFRDIKLSDCIVTVLSSAFLAFGLYHVHSLSGVTEGGVIGLNLLLDHWFAISPAVTNFVANVICYLLGWKLLGRTFIMYSAVATVSFSVFYAILEQFEHLWPQFADMPLLAALIGALFVGIGCGFCVKVGGAVSGDDALAMCISHVLHIGVEKAYLITDLSVLALSMTYIPLRRIGYSLLTVILSGQIIGWIQRIPLRQKKPL